MHARARVLTVDAARAFYDRFGAKQDKQGFYEDAPIECLLRHGDFERADSVFEFGCGTGKLALRLLEDYLPPGATYLGNDISPVMVELAVDRLRDYPARARALPAAGGALFPLAERSVDRVVATYVLDLLSPEDIEAFFSECARVLNPGGRVCVASLTPGTTPLARVVSALWRALFRLRPALVGGCRPIRVDDYLDRQQWRVLHRQVLAPWGIASEAIVLARDDLRDNSPET